MGENFRQDDPIGILEGHARSEPYMPPSEEAELVGQLKDRFDEAQKARLQWERDSNFYLSYLQGNQVILRSPLSNDVFRATLVNPDKKLTSIDNQVRVAERALVGKLTRIIPGATVMPASDDAADLRGAVIAESLLKYLYRKEKLRQKYLRGCKQLPWAGTAIYQVLWDPQAGSSLSQCPSCNYLGGPEMVDQPCPHCQMGQVLGAQAGGMPMGAQEAPTMQQGSEGDVRVRLHDPRDCFPEPGAADIDEMRYFIIQKSLPVSEVRAMFPDKAANIHSEPGVYSDRTVGYYGRTHHGGMEAEYLADYVYLYEYHEKPTLKFAKGRVVWMANDMILKQMDSPYWMLGRLPFFAFKYTTNEGEFWGECPMQHAWHQQKERNKLLSQLRAQRELTLNPQRLVPIQSRISVGEWDDQPGHHVVYNPMGGKPEYLPMPQFPNYVYQEADRLRTAILDKFAVTDQEMGSSSGDPSGRYAAILESQSSESVAPIIVENNAEWLELNRAMLMLAQAYYQEERTWTVTGHDRPQTHTLKQMNLAPGWDLELAEEDSLSTNPALRLQQASNLLQLGVFNDPQTGLPDLRLFKRVAGLRLPGVGPDLQGAEHAYAASIPERLKRGEPVVPRPWDDARIMTEELIGWLRGEGRSAPEPLVQAIGQLFMAYAQMMMPVATVADTSILPNQGVQQQPAPPQNGPAAAGGAQAPPSAQEQLTPEPEQIIAQADQGGESLARPGEKHEG